MKVKPLSANRILANHSCNMPAEYGHTPNVVNATLKSGTNQYHGTVFELVPADAQQNHLAREMASFEWMGRGDRHGLLPYQTASPISQWNRGIYGGARHREH
jgi:hypothetical protein